MSLAPHAIPYRDKKKLSELVDEIPTVFNTPEIRIECEDELKINIINIVSKNLRKENSTINNAIINTLYLSR